ncbi:hypothetical protein [Marinobacter salarius]|uniref:hypothetical protein n=1 Tax=Marinobacter salarius TaxID=1420917 RepID=UPI003D9C4DAC
MIDDKSQGIEINCPICKEKHQYSLKVSKSHVIHNMFNGMDTSTKYIRVRRVFICPKEKKEFQATLKLPQHFGEMIEDVKVNNDQQREH